MTTWDDMAQESRTAAAELSTRERWRSSVSRAYYAIYAKATAMLNSAGVNMPAGRSNPSHRRLPVMIGNNLTAIDNPRRWRLADLVQQLYNLRIIADYEPNMAIEEDEARIALSLMSQAFRCLEK